MFAERLDSNFEMGDNPALIAARSSFRAFVAHVKPDFEFNWHHEIMIENIQRWIDGTITRLMIFLAPQHGKSLLVSILLPAYLLGIMPDDPIVACSYNNTYASGNNRKVQAVIDSDLYREVFPGTQLAQAGVKGKKTQRTTSKFEVVGRRGSYMSAGVTTGLAGNPFIFGIIDDAYADDKDAYSPTIRDNVWNWFTTTFMARKTKAGARVLIIQTLWHMLDLCGELLQRQRSDPRADQWTVVRFPALLETEDQREPGDSRQIGEALWESRHHRVDLEEMRRNATPALWSAVYQQNPTPSKGTYFTRNSFRYFTTADVGGVRCLILRGVNGAEDRTFAMEDCLWFQTSDAADTVGIKSDYTAVGTFCVTPEKDLCVWHCWRKKLEYPKRYRAIIDLRTGTESGPWPVPISFSAMENKSSGISMIQQAALDGVPFRMLKPGNKSKTQRAGWIVPMYENGKVYHHQSQSWLSDFEASLLAFPAGRHDEEFDIVAYAGEVVTTDSLAGVGGRIEGDLLMGTEAPRDEHGRTSLVGTSLADYGNVVYVGRHRVTFEDDD